MKLVYIGGPFTAATAWDIEQNIRRAEEIGLFIAKHGAMPVIPHTNTRFFFGQCTAQFWYDGTMELARRCDALVLVPGWRDSKGTVEEHEYFKSAHKPIFEALLAGRGAGALSPAEFARFKRWLAGEEL